MNQVRKEEMPQIKTESPPTSPASHSSSPPLRDTHKTNDPFLSLPQIKTESPPTSPASRSSSPPPSRDTPKTNEPFQTTQGIIETKLGMVTFSAKWCTPCKKAKAFFEKQMSSFAHIRQYLLDVDEQKTLLHNFKQRWNVAKVALPASFCLENGVIVACIEGASEEKLKQRLVFLEQTR